MTLPLKLDAERERLVQAVGPLLILGGPGSGKTTIALIKADNYIKSGVLKPGQKVLFLSFARATVARVSQHARELVASKTRNSLEISTYHGFAWSILQSHGYLLSSRRTISLIEPPQAAARLAHLSESEREAEKLRLFREDGLLHFDLFASQCAELLCKSSPLAKIISDSYPLVILDEFQDTNAEEWAMIQAIGRSSTIIALADPNQRIYEFRGADPIRIQEYIDLYKPSCFDFASENHRSNGTDIVTFANDLLTDTHKPKKYKDVCVIRYTYYKNCDPCFSLKTAVLAGIKRVSAGNQKGWSIACLIPSKRLMIAVSDCLSSTKDKLPSLNHDVAMDQEGPALAGLLVASLLESNKNLFQSTALLIANLCSHIRGRRGTGSPPQPELEMTDALTGYLDSKKMVRGKNRIQIVTEAGRIAEAASRLEFVGDPVHDWLLVRKLFESSTVEWFQNVAYDARFLRLLTRGTMLRDQLNEIWRENHSYKGALRCVELALRQEHFSASLRDPTGLQVMTMHKSKGKEYDEVFIFEGYKRGKLLRNGASLREVAQARLALRVAVTRARTRATILIPKSEPCSFF